MWNPRCARPAVTDSEISDVLSQTYGLNVTSCVQLSSYDDRNFHVLVEHNGRNPHIGPPDRNGYVLKICSNLVKESGRCRFEAHIRMMLHVRSEGIVCPEPIKTVDGRYYHVQTFQTADQTPVDCLIRLCGFIEGEVLSRIPITGSIMREAGTYLGRLRKCLTGFPSAHLEAPDSPWSFAYIPKLKDLLPCVPDLADRLLAEDVIDSWLQVTAKYRDSLPTEPVHGDFNEHNILVKHSDDDEAFHVCGILDFGDATVGYYVYDLGILIMYMMTFGREPVLDAGGHVLSGYLIEHTLDEVAKQMLFYSVAARLVQSLLIGLYSYSKTGDEFQLETQRSGWAALKSLWAEKMDGTLSRWWEVAASSGAIDRTVARLHV